MEQTPAFVRVTRTVERPARVQMDYDQIARLVAFDELPAVPGCLSHRAFQDAVCPLLRAKPFRPFELELRSGRTLVLQSPCLTLSGRFGCVTYFDPPEILWFTTDRVVRVTALAPVAAG